MITGAAHAFIIMAGHAGVKDGRMRVGGNRAMKTGTAIDREKRLVYNKL